MTVSIESVTPVAAEVPDYITCENMTNRAVAPLVAPTQALLRGHGLSEFKQTVEDYVANVIAEKYYNRRLEHPATAGEDFQIFNHQRDALELRERLESTMETAALQALPDGYTNRDKVAAEIRKTKAALHQMDDTISATVNNYLADYPLKLDVKFMGEPSVDNTRA